jgi:hypothetical protein
MLDLETWGVLPGSALRSVGACGFDPLTGEIGETFYRNITDASCQSLGLTKDPRTVRWWAEQSEAAKRGLEDNQCPIGDALIDFASWWKRINGVQIYGHGANFDPVLLQAAYEAAMLDVPWHFWNVRCSRTILAAANRKPLREGFGKGVHHNALDDAVAQAKAVAAAFRTGSFAPH